MRREERREGSNRLPKWGKRVVMEEEKGRRQTQDRGRENVDAEKTDGRETHMGHRTPEGGKNHAHKHPKLVEREHRNKRRREKADVQDKVLRRNVSLAEPERNPTEKEAKMLTISKTGTKTTTEAETQTGQRTKTEIIEARMTQPGREMKVALEAKTWNDPGTGTETRTEINMRRDQEIELVTRPETKIRNGQGTEIETRTERGIVEKKDLSHLRKRGDGLMTPEPLDSSQEQLRGTHQKETCLKLNIPVQERGQMYPCHLNPSLKQAKNCPADLKDCLLLLLKNGLLAKTGKGGERG